MVTDWTAGRPQTSQTRMVRSPMHVLLSVRREPIRFDSVAPTQWDCDPGVGCTNRLIGARRRPILDPREPLQLFPFVMCFDVPDGAGARPHHHGIRGGAVVVVRDAAEQGTV